MGNGFITAVLGINWLLQRTLLPYDKLLVSLGASSFFLQWAVVGKNIYVSLHPTAFPYNPVLQLLSFLLGLPECCHHMVLHLAPSLLLCEDCNLYPSCLLLAKVQGAWVGIPDAAQLGGTLWLEKLSIFKGNQKIHENKLRSKWQLGSSLE